MCFLRVTDRSSRLSAVGSIDLGKLLRWRRKDVGVGHDRQQPMTSKLKPKFDMWRLRVVSRSWRDMHRRGFGFGVWGFSGDYN